MFCSPEHGPSQWPLLIRFAFFCFFGVPAYGFPQFLSCPQGGAELAGEDRAATSLALRTLTHGEPRGEAPWEEPSIEIKTHNSNMLMAKRRNKQP